MQLLARGEMKNARCTNYGDCSVADSGKSYQGDFCPECKKPATGPASKGLSSGATIAITLTALFLVFAGLVGVGAWYAWNWWQSQVDELVVEDGTATPPEKKGSWTWPWQKNKQAGAAETHAESESEIPGSRKFEGMPEEMTPPKWWQKWWGLPSDGDLKKSLQKQVKPGVRIRSLKLVAVKKLEADCFALEYEVTARVERAVYSVPSAPASVPATWNLKPDEAELFKEVVRAPNLRPGDSYDWSKKRLVEDAKESATFTWNVGEARKINGRWVAMRWAPFVLERHNMNPGGT